MSFLRAFSRRQDVGRSLVRSFSLRARLEEIIPVKQQELKDLKASKGNELLGTCTVEQAIGGMRSVKSMLWETSLLDAEEGIRFRGRTIPELHEQLPYRTNHPTPEALLWLLMTGEIPTQEEVDGVTADFASRAALPDGVEDAIRAFPKTMHPMTQLASGILLLQQSSKFAKAYAEGINKKEYFGPVFEDSMDLMARLPKVAGLIYRNVFHDGVVPEWDTSLDYSQNYARMLGWNDAGFDDLMRLYLVIHSDHEGGNVSAHTTHLVGSALSDPYLSLTAGMCGLAGPLHGLANQEVLKWTMNFYDELKAQGKEITHESVREQAWATLNAGKVIPGFGHAVLRKTDPRYTSQREFALANMPHDPLVNLVSVIYEVVPDVLTEHGKTKNPWPNVDAHSGVLLRYYGLTEMNYYTVLFGVSRAFGVLSQLTWDRALGLPLERPKSVTSEWIRENI
jgi:citrate synthase